jgi:hypothetical protein
LRVEVFIDEQLSRAGTGASRVIIYRPNEDLVSGYRHRIAKMITSGWGRAQEGLKQRARDRIKQIGRAAEWGASREVLPCSNEDLVSGHRHRTAKTITSGRSRAQEGLKQRACDRIK